MLHRIQFLLGRRASTRVFNLWPVLGALLLSGPAVGASFVSDRAALNADDFVDWGVLKQPSDDITNITLPSPIELKSASSGLDVTVEYLPGGSRDPLLRLFQEDDGISWNGNFSPDDFLLSTGFGGSILITFEEPISAAGAQIQRAALGNFTGRIEAFDADGISLGAFTRDGVSDQVADDSAILLGIVSPDDDIMSISFDVRGPQFAINRLDFTLVPEPASLGLFISGLLACVCRRPASQA